MTAYERKTGPGMAYILCDICGRKIHQKDAILITDKWNTKYGLLVCKHDVDKTNEQNRPFIVRELQVQNPKLLRSERPDINTSPDTSIVPGSPQNVIATMNSLTNQIVLQWIGPQNTGSSPILGYIITRAVPQDSFYITIANTSTNNGETSACYFTDTVNDPSIPSSYIIYAINSAGQGTASNIAFFPNQQVFLENGKYIITSQNSYLITTGDGRYITTGS